MNEQCTKVIIMAGAGESGKDTLVKEMRKEWEKAGYHVVKTSSVEPAKAAGTLLGWDGIKDEKGRQLLVDLKQASIRYDDHPHKYITGIIGRYTSSPRTAIDTRCSPIADHIECRIFIDIREPEEIIKLELWCKANDISVTIVLVTKPDATKFTNTADMAEISEPDMHIINDGPLAKLKEAATVLCSFIG